MFTNADFHLRALCSPSTLSATNVSVDATVFLHAVEVSVSRQRVELLGTVHVSQDAGRLLLYLQLRDQRGRHATVSFQTTFAFPRPIIYIIHSASRVISLVSHSRGFHRPRASFLSRFESVSAGRGFILSLFGNY